MLSGLSEEISDDDAFESLPLRVVPENKKAISFAESRKFPAII